MTLTPTRRQLLTFAGLGAGVAALAACGDAGGDGGDTGSGATPGGEATSGDGILRVATQTPTSLIPGNSRGFFALSLSETLFSGLLNYDPETGEPTPLVAASVETEDNIVWDITLHDGWTFHNGEPVDAASFARGWNATANPENAWVGSSQLANIAGYDELNPAEGEPTADELSGVEVIDDLHLRVTLQQAQNQFLYQIAQPAFYPLPEAALQDLDSYATAPIGNGPYQIVEPWTGGPEILTERYGDYGGEPARNGGITFKIYNGYDVSFRDFQAGEVDITGVLPADRPAAETLLGDRLVESGGTDFTYLTLPVWHETYGDASIRQALSLAIDRQAIIDALLDPSYTVLTDFGVPAQTGYRSDANAEFLTYDPDRARELWDEAGGIEGTLALTVVTGTGRDAWSEAIINQWAEVFGVDVTLEFIPSENTHAALFGHEVPNPASLNIPVANPSPTALLSVAFATGGGSNYGGYSNPEVDDLLVQAGAAATDEEAQALFDQVKDLLLVDIPLIPLWSPGSATAVAETVGGYITDDYNRSPYWRFVVE